MLRVMISELKRELIGLRIDRITQPQRGAFVFSLRNRHLLISVEPSAAYLALTDQKFSNPPEPPMFCMLLRKYLLGATLTDIRQEGCDRTAYFVFSALNSAFEHVERTLVAEVMGRHANLLLLDESGNIIDCIKRAALDARQALPGLPYEPFSDSRANILSADRSVLHADTPFLKEYQGFSKLSARFAASHPDRLSALLGSESGQRGDDGGEGDGQNAGAIKGAEQNDERKESDAKESGRKVRGYTAADAEGTVLDFYHVREALEEMYPGAVIREHESLSDATNAYYMRSLQAVKRKKLTQDFKKVLTSKLTRIEGKIDKMTEELEAARNSEHLRNAGDLLLTHAHAIREGDSKAILTDYEGKAVEIALDTRLSPTENAQRYYRRYKKSVSAVRHISEQLKDAHSDAEYLSHAIVMLDQAESEGDIDEIRKELEDAGFIGAHHDGKNTKSDRAGGGRGRKKGANKTKTPLNVHRYRLSSGKTLLIGKSNTANDELTMKYASNSDIWLHTNTIPGSHCIIRCEGKEADNRDLEEAARAAAYFSKARQSSKVAVDYCRVKDVKKPPGARPGMVIYANFKTVIVDPSVEGIQKSEGKDRE